MFWNAKLLIIAYVTWKKVMKNSIFYIFKMPILLICLS